MTNKEILRVVVIASLHAHIQISYSLIHLFYCFYKCFPDNVRDSNSSNFLRWPHYCIISLPLYTHSFTIGIYCPIPSYSSLLWRMVITYSLRILGSNCFTFTMSWKCPILSVRWLISLSESQFYIYNFNEIIHKLLKPSLRSPHKRKPHLQLYYILLHNMLKPILKTENQIIPLRWGAIH